MAADEGVAQRCDTLRKPELDERSYRWLALQNKMEVLLISDSKADKAAAAMDVAVGHASDPDELPGLAHFLEHMLFLGTEKYPDEGSYQQFLSEHGGSSVSAQMPVPPGRRRTQDLSHDHARRARTECLHGLREHQLLL